MPVQHEEKLLFIHIPKTGGSSINDNENFKWDGLVEKINVNDRTYNQRHLTANEIIELNLEDAKIFNEYFCFCFIRNPWDRLVSSYFNIGKKYFESFESYVENAQLINEQYDAGKDPYLDERWEHARKLIVNKFFKPQLDFITYNNEIIIDFIGSFENYKEDFKKLCDKLNKPCEILHSRSSKHTHYSEYYTNETKEIVGEIYKRDIDYFNYEFKRIDR